MRMRSVLSALLALIMLLGLTGCAAAEEKTVTIWHSFTGEQETYLQDAAEAFNAANAGIKVVVQSQPVANFADNVFAAVTEGVGPDIIFNYASVAAAYLEGGYLTDLSQYIYGDDTGIADFDSLLGEGQLAEVNGFADGLIHYLPAYTTGPILYYNKTLYNELGLSVPTTWEELTANCEKIRAAKGIPGVGLNSLVDMIHMLIMESGSGYIDVENECVLFDTPAVREKIDWLCAQVKEGNYTIFSTGDYFTNDFNAGIIGSYIGSCAHYPYITPDGFEFGMAAIPATTWYPSWNRGPIVFYYKDDARAEAAYDFVKYFISPDVNAGWAVVCNALSPYQGALDNADYAAFLSGDTLAALSIRAVEAHLDIAGSLPAVTGANTVRNAIEDAVIKACGGEMTPDEAWTEAVILSNSALKGE